MLKEYDQGFKIIIAGSSGVGKSCLLLRFVDNVFSSSTLSTIGVDFKFKTMDINGTTVKMQIWDTAGSQAFRSIVSAYYRGANAVVLVYKKTDKLTFNELSEFWINEVNKYKQPDCQIMLLANMSDLSGNDISQEQVTSFMEAHNISLFFQTSAKTGDQVVNAFRKLGEKLLNKHKLQKKAVKRDNQHLKMSIGYPQEEKKKKGCCK